MSGSDKYPMLRLAVAVFVSLLTSATVALLTPTTLLQATKWGWMIFIFYLLWEFSYGESGRKYGLKFRGLYGDKPLMSYFLVPLLFAGLGLAVWVGLNKLYKESSRLSREPAPTEPRPEAANNTAPNPTSTPSLSAVSNQPKRLDATRKVEHSDEVARRIQLLEKLRHEYILSHDGISPALMAGTEQPPADWINQRLGELGEKWRVSERQQQTDAAQTLGNLKERTLDLAQQIFNHMYSHGWHVPPNRQFQGTVIIPMPGPQDDAKING